MYVLKKIVTATVLLSQTLAIQPMHEQITSLDFRSTKLEKLKKNNHTYIPLCLCAQTFRKLCIFYMLYTACITFYELQLPQEEYAIPWQWLYTSFRYTQQIKIIGCALAKILCARYVSKWAVEYTCPKIMRKKVSPNHTACTDC